jgi:hypothetical protein
MIEAEIEAEVETGRTKTKFQNKWANSHTESSDKIIVGVVAPRPTLSSH